MKQIYLGIGSNLNYPLLQLKKAIALIKGLPKTQFIQASSFFQSQPIGPIDQPDFINAVLELKTGLNPIALLKALQEIEKQMGRIKGGRWRERIIDIDILFYARESIEIKEPIDLKIPHPEIKNRLFVLAPLAEIAPQFTFLDGSRIKLDADKFKSYFLRRL